MKRKNNTKARKTPIADAKIVLKKLIGLKKGMRSKVNYFPDRKRPVVPANEENRVEAVLCRDVVLKAL
jgi:hypothetical protein